MQAGKLAGGNPKNGRVDNDFYATDPAAVNMLFDALATVGCPVERPVSFMEPCVGNGNIAGRVLQMYPSITDTAFVDVVDRGYPGTELEDFLAKDFGDRRFDLIVTNPPYSLALEFVQKCRELLVDGGLLAMFLRIQYWEGEKRRADLLASPPVYCFPFAKRMPIWNNGRPRDENGKRWATTLCHAWFVWKKGNTEMCRTMPI